MELRIDHVSKAYGGQAVLRDVTVTVGSGVTCLMAPSGAGKTTLLRILLGLERPDSGTVYGLEGRRLAAVFQEDRLLEQQDWRGNLRFVLGSAFDEAEALTLLEELGLSDTGAQPVGEWSGGMKRRLALARALLAPFDVLILDEPFTGLDGDNRRRAAGSILARTAQRPVLLVTHDEADAKALSARIIHLF